MMPQSKINTDRIFFRQTYYPGCKVIQRYVPERRYYCHPGKYAVGAQRFNGKNTLKNQPMDKQNTKNHPALQCQPKPSFKFTACHQSKRDGPKHSKAHNAYQRIRKAEYISLGCG